MRNHISIAQSFRTSVRCIIHGEEPLRAFRTCFALRRYINGLYDMGMSHSEVLEALSGEVTEE